MRSTRFLGVNIESKYNGMVYLTQPYLIDQIIKDLRLEDENMTTNPISESSSKLLSRHYELEAFEKYFDS